MILFGDFDKTIEDIKEEYHKQVARADYAYKCMEKWNKDEEIQHYKQQMEETRKHCLINNLSDKEIIDITAFKEKHFRECCGNGEYKAKGNTWIYTITGTGIGHCIKITCPECGESADITDFDSW